ncbi:hypothetical protein [Methylobacterium sp. JK268]
MGGMRGQRAALALTGILAAWAAHGQEAGAPLVLRIRPQPEPAVVAGPGAEGSGAEDAAEGLRRAEAARAAFEARVTARAQRAIASVCTGCLVPETVVASVFETPPR